MKTKTFRQSVLTATALLMSSTTFAQEEKQFEIAPAADLVSSYVWRGVYQTGPSVQPSIALSYAGVSLTAWGSTDFSSMSDPDKGKEFDLILGYGIGGFNVGVTDYWWSGEGSRYGNYSSSHFFEGTVGYNFGESFPLGITWSTMFAGGDKKANGDQQFSTYVEASYAFSVLGVDVTPSIGVSPWTGMYHREGTDGFALSTIALKAGKEIRITDSFALPVFAQCIVAPNQDNVFLVFGISIK